MIKHIFKYILYILTDKDCDLSFKEWRIREIKQEIKKMKPLLKEQMADVFGPSPGFSSAYFKIIDRNYFKEILAELGKYNSKEILTIYVNQRVYHCLKSLKDSSGKWILFVDFTRNIETFFGHIIKIDNRIKDFKIVKESPPTGNKGTK